MIWYVHLKSGGQIGVVRLARRLDDKSYPNTKGDTLAGSVTQR
jgi:hypothetical protein